MSEYCFATLDFVEGIAKLEDEWRKIMLEQRRDQYLIPMMLLIVTLALLAFFVIWTISNQVSLTQVAQTTITDQTVPAVQVVDPIKTANTIKFNQQVSGLAPNWNAFQASLNYADYPSQVVAQQEMNKLVNSWNSSPITFPDLTLAQREVLAQQEMNKLVNSWNSSPIAFPDLTLAQREVLAQQEMNKLVNSWNSSPITFPDLTLVQREVLAQQATMKLWNSWSSSPITYSDQITAQYRTTALVMDVPLVSLTSSLDYNLPKQREFVMDVPLVSLTSSLDYNLAQQREFVMDVPLVSLTSSLDYNLPKQHEFVMDVPLVSLTAGLDYNLPK
jgi:hypothetical protein